MVKKLTVGVLALQGDFREHLRVLDYLGVIAKEIRLPHDLITIDGIILPGGESTTMANLLDVFSLREPLRERIKNGLPVWGTCAGMILLAGKLIQEKPVPLGLMDSVVDRNAFGRQINSFSVPLAVQVLGARPLEATFIRAPIIKEVGKDVSILAQLSDGVIVAAQEGKMLATSFHPELTEDLRLHEYFISLC